MAAKQGFVILSESGRTPQRCFAVLFSNGLFCWCSDLEDQEFIGDIFNVCNCTSFQQHGAGATADYLCIQTDSKEVIIKSHDNSSIKDWYQAIQQTATTNNDQPLFCAPISFNAQQYWGVVCAHALYLYPAPRDRPLLKPAEEAKMHVTLLAFSPFTTTDPLSFVITTSLPLADGSISRKQLHSLAHPRLLTVESAAAAVLRTFAVRSKAERAEWLRLLHYLSKRREKQRTACVETLGWLIDHSGNKVFAALTDGKLSCFANEAASVAQTTVSVADCVVKKEALRTFRLSPAAGVPLIFSTLRDEQLDRWLVCLSKPNPTAGRSRSATDSSVDGVIRTGSLEWKGKQRFFIAREKKLLWFNTAPTAVSKARPNAEQRRQKEAGSIMLRGALLYRHAQALRLYLLPLAAKPYVFTAASEAELRDWLQALTPRCNAIDRSKKNTGEKQGRVEVAGRKRILQASGCVAQLFNDRLQPRQVVPLARATVEATGTDVFQLRTAQMHAEVKCPPQELRDWVKALSVQILKAAADSNHHRYGGWLMMDGKFRWFAVRDGYLCWFSEKQAQSFEVPLKHRLKISQCEFEPMKDTVDCLVVRAPNQQQKVLHACDATEMEAWLRSLQMQRRSTSSNVDPPKLSLSRSGVVFGRALKELERGKMGAAAVLEACIVALDNPPGYLIDGLFAATLTDTAPVRKLIKQWDSGATPAFGPSDHREAAAVLMHFLAKLPEPFIPFKLRSTFFEARTDVSVLRVLVQTLPIENLVNLRHLLDYLSLLAVESELECNGAVNLAGVFAPLLIGKPSLKDEETDEVDLLKAVLTLSTLISHFDEIFEAQAVLTEKIHQAQQSLQDTIPPPAPSARRLFSDDEWMKDLRSAAVQKRRGALPTEFVKAAEKTDDTLRTLRGLTRELLLARGSVSTTSLVNVGIKPPAPVAAAVPPPAAAAAAAVVPPTIELAEGVDAETQLHYRQPSQVPKSAKSRLTQEELVHVKSELDKHIGRAVLSQTATPPAHAAQSASSNDDHAIDMLDELFDELQAEKASNKQDEDMRRTLRHITVNTRQQKPATPPMPQRSLSRMLREFRSEDDDD